MATKEPLKDFKRIPAKRFFTIGEASELCGVAQSTLRYWEEKFSGILKIQRRKNRRYFTQENLKLIREISILMEEQGFTADGVIQFYKDRKNEPESSPRPFELLEIREIIQELRDIQKGLRNSSV